MTIFGIPENPMRNAMSQEENKLSDEHLQDILDGLSGAKQTAYVKAMQSAITELRELRTELQSLCALEPQQEEADDVEPSTDWNALGLDTVEYRLRRRLHPTPVQKVQESQTVSALEALLTARVEMCEALSNRAQRHEVRIEALSAKLALAETALEPFAKFDVGPAGDGVFSIPDGHPLLGEGLGDNWKPAVIVGDFRRARSTLHSIRDE